MLHWQKFLSGLFIVILLIRSSNQYEIDCHNLRMGQYICPDPDYDFIDPKTQQPTGCKQKKNNVQTATGLSNKVTQKNQNNL